MRLNRLMARASKARAMKPYLWVGVKKKAWRDIDDTVPLERAPEADRWAVLNVSPRMEAKAAEALRDAGYQAWFPQTVETEKLESRKIRRKFNLPLFPRYVFAAPGEGEGRRIAVWPDRDTCRVMLEALRGVGATLPAEFGVRSSVLGMLACDHVGQLVGYVPQVVLDNLSDRQSGGEFVVKKVKPFARGAKVQIQEGSFAGFDGIVEVDGHERVKVLISLFGHTSLVELEVGMLREVA